MKRNVGPQKGAGRLLKRGEGRPDRDAAVFLASLRERNINERIED